MYTIKKIYTAKQEIKKSTFISYLCPINEFQTFHEILKQQHPKAVHIVWAYRKLNKYLQIMENQSDDKEPKGTSGPPSLNSLRGADLIDAGIFIVRYFGGIKLGTGGLVRAYSSSANLAINQAELIKFEIKDKCILFIPFALISRFDHFFEKEDIKIKKEFNEYGCTIICKIQIDKFKKLYEFAHFFEPEGFKFEAMPLFSKIIVKEQA